MNAYVINLILNTECKIMHFNGFKGIRMPNKLCPLEHVTREECANVRMHVCRDIRSAARIVNVLDRSASTCDRRNFADNLLAGSRSEDLRFKDNLLTVVHPRQFPDFRMSSGSISPERCSQTSLFMCALNKILISKRNEFMLNCCTSMFVGIFA